MVQDEGHSDAFVNDLTFEQMADLPKGLAIEA